MYHVRSNSREKKFLFFCLIVALPTVILTFYLKSLSGFSIASTLLFTFISFFTLILYTTHNSKLFSSKAIFGCFLLLMTIQSYVLFTGIAYVASRGYRGTNIRKIAKQFKPINTVFEGHIHESYSPHKMNGSPYTHLKSYIKQALNIVLPRKFPYTEKFLGFNISFKDYGPVEALLEEVFINNLYFFHSPVDNPTIIDAGSNIGISILYFKKLYPKSKIIAFEPDEYAYSFLEKNIKNNKLNDIQLHKKALSDANGETVLYSDTGSMSSVCNSIFKWSDQLKIKQKIKTVKLSQYINTKIDLLKLDIEGSELPVLEDLALQGKLKFIEKIIMEYHHHMGCNTDNISKLFKILEDNNFGYHIGSIGRLTADTTKQNTMQAFMISAYKKQPNFPTKT